MTATWGRETVTLVQIDQPLCTHSYGDAFGSPTGQCNAVLGALADKKCFNTRGSCQATDKYNPGTLTLTFGMNQPGLSKHYGFVIPTLLEVDTAPATVNIGARDLTQPGLGTGEEVTLVFEDKRYNDHLVDKYRHERLTGGAASGSPPDLYDPVKRGTFWGKWLARNPYYMNYTLRVYQGFLGQSLSEMRCRTYLITKIDGPSDGQVKLVADDIFSRIFSATAVAPKPSRGRLSADMTGSPASFTVSPSDIVDEDYPSEEGSPSQLYVAIGEEIIRCSRASATFTILERGALGTTQEDHEEDDLVQRVLRYTTDAPQDIVYDLFCNYTELGRVGSPDGSDYIDKAAWDEAAEPIDNLYSAVLAKPTPVKDLVGELAQQAAFSVWPNVTTGMIEFKALRAGNSRATITDRNYIIDGSLSIKRLTDKRVSQVWVFYGQINPLEELSEEKNYRSRLVVADLVAEELYGSANIYKVYSRWIPKGGRTIAQDTGNRLLAMFTAPPTEARFAVHTSRSDDIRLADYITLSTADVQDDTGATESVQHAVVEVEHGEKEIAARTQSVVFYDDAASGNERLIYIETDDFNINLRTLHDTLFDAPVGGSPGETVRFIIESGVVVGSEDPSSPAIQVGTWPAGVTKYLENNGRIQGCGGLAGVGGDQGTSYDGQPGQTGGTALLADSAIFLDNSNGQIWAGGGGGGGGGGTRNDNLGLSRGTGGGGGGGGAGTEGGTQANGGTNFSFINAPGSAGTAGTADAGGGGGAAGNNAAQQGGAGGAGGAPGQAGSAGNPPAVGGNVSNGAGGAAGPAGRYIDGIANVTFTGSPVGDLRGNVA